MDEHKGATTLKTRERLAIKVFQRTAAYDAAIAAHLNDTQETEASFSISLPLCQELRYGENPHQRASLYGYFTDHFKQIQGKELSYTNVIDIAATRTEALEAIAKKKPGLVLADIQLADGSSGIDAVKDILGMINVPVIFITAFPERLLTGERPEPTFLITKPFQPSQLVEAVNKLCV